MSNEKTAHKILTDLEESGDLKKLIRAGFCQPCILRDLNIFRSVDAHVQTGSKITKAVYCVAMDFKLSERHVRNIVKTFK